MLRSYTFNITKQQRYIHCCQYLFCIPKNIQRLKIQYNLPLYSEFLSMQGRVCIDSTLCLNKSVHWTTIRYSIYQLSVWVNWKYGTVCSFRTYLKVQIVLYYFKLHISTVQLTKKESLKDLYRINRRRNVTKQQKIVQCQI